MKRLLRTRNKTAPPNTWRTSVRVYTKSWFNLYNDVQMGPDRTLPGQDTVKAHCSRCVTGPELTWRKKQGTMEVQNGRRTVNTSAVSVKDMTNASPNHHG